MKAKLLSFLKSLFVLALGLLLLYYVFKGQDLAEMVESLKMQTTTPGLFHAVRVFSLCV